MIKKSTVEYSTVKHDLCIGCGICDASCPTDAITMTLNHNKEWQPVIDQDKCTNCAICVAHCPNSKKRLYREAQKLKDLEDKHAYGLENGEYYVSWDRNVENRKESASGGVTTAIISQMLEQKMVDGVIHGAMTRDKLGGLHYEASMSNTTQEVVGKKSSFYFALCFSTILKTLRGQKSKRYLLIGTPCVVRAVTKLLKQHKYYKGVKLYSIALACSHNTNAQFTDFFAESLGVSKDEFFKINLRHHDDKVKNAKNFNNAVITDYKTIIINRFKSIFTTIWRKYYFAMNVCNYCSDFWGYTADISVKDAWGKWSKDPKDVMGKNIVVIRNPEINTMFQNMQNLAKEKLTFSEVRDCQKQTTQFKHVETWNKNSKSLFNIRNIRNGLLLTTFYLKLTKFLYRKFGYWALRIFLNVTNFSSKVTQMPKNKYKSIRKKLKKRSHKKHKK